MYMYILVVISNSANTVQKEVEMPSSVNNYRMAQPTKWVPAILDYT